MNKHLTRALAAISLAGALGFPAVAHAQNVSYPTIKATVNGVSVPAIVVRNTTYVSTRALSVAHTAYEQVNSSTYDVLGWNESVVTYNGQSYIPWACLAPSVKATKIPGGWAFAADQDYQLKLVYDPQAFAGNWDMVRIYTLDGNRPAPGQAFDMKIYYGGTNGAPDEIIDKTSQDGAYEWGFNEVKPTSDSIVLTWTDPEGIKHVGTATVTFVSQTPSSTPIPPDDHLVAQTAISVINDEVLFDAQVNGVDMTFQLDTGAMMPLISANDAKKLNLPNLGTIEVAGVGGTNQAYLSQMNVTIGGVTFENVPCIVDPSYQYNSLFGYSFFADHQYDLLVSLKHHTLSILD